MIPLFFPPMILPELGTLSLVPKTRGATAPDNRPKPFQQWGVTNVDTFDRDCAPVTGISEAEEFRIERDVEDVDCEKRAPEGNPGHKLWWGSVTWSSKIIR